MSVLATESGRARQEECGDLFRNAARRRRCTWGRSKGIRRTPIGTRRRQNSEDLEGLSTSAEGVLFLFDIECPLSLKKLVGRRLVVLTQPSPGIGHAHFCDLNPEDYEFRQPTTDTYEQKLPGV